MLPLAAGPVAVVAGAGRFPLLLVDRLTELGRECRILAFRGFADPAVRVRADRTVDLLDVSGAVACLDAWRPAAVTLAGGVRRPSAGAILNAYAFLRNRDEIAAVAARGDDNILRGVIMLLEERGHRLIGARELAPDLMAASGLYGRHAPGEAARRSIEIGLDVLRGLSPFDVGQATVIAAERVIAIEGPEGTDRMVGRVRALRSGRLWGRRERGGVLVKAPKWTQDLRIDLPAVGPRTVLNAARAGLDGIAVAARATLVLDRDETVATADRLGLFLIGVEAHDALGPEP